MKTMLKKTMLSVFAMTIVMPLAMPTKRVRSAEKEPKSQPEQKIRKQFKIITTPALTVIGKDSQGEYSITISPEAQKLSIYFKNLMNSCMKESILKNVNLNEIYDTIPRSDAQLFFRLLEELAPFATSKNEKTDLITIKRFFKKELDETNIASIITLTSYFHITSWYSCLADRLVEITELSDIKLFLQTVSLNHQFLVKIFKKLLTCYQENAVGNITSLTGETFSLAEVNEMKSLASRNIFSNEHNATLNHKTLHCTLYSVYNIDIILQDNGINIKSLTALNLSDNQIQDIKPISNLPNLSILDLNNNKIETIESIQLLKNLEYLYLRNNILRSIKGLENHPNLTELDLSKSKNKIQDAEIIKTLKLNTLRF